MTTGVCVSTSSCSSAGGSTIDNACPGDPADIKCCTKTSCDNGADGNCRWTSDCAGNTVANECPGPAGMMCCSSNSTGFGGYDAPSLPPSSSCEQVAIDGADLVDQQFPGYTREMFCIRDCACTSSSSDHCCGKAIDWMIADSGGAATMAGEEMAEWIMENRSSLNLKYVIWGQRIWNAGSDSEAPWSDWEVMEDRGDITQNHWLVFFSSPRGRGRSASLPA